MNHPWYGPTDAYNVIFNNGEHTEPNKQREECYLCTVNVLVSTSGWSSLSL